MIRVYSVYSIYRLIVLKVNFISKLDYVHYFTQKSVLVKYFLEPSESNSMFDLGLILRERLVDYLIGNHTQLEKGYCELFHSETFLYDLKINDGVANSIKVILSSLRKNRQSACPPEEPREIALAFVTGEKGSGRKFQIKHALRSKKEKCLFINLKNN